MLLSNYSSKITFILHLYPITCDSDQHSYTLEPGPGVIVAIPDPAAVIPRLLWAELSEDEGSSVVGEGKVRPNLGIRISLRGKNRAVQEPGDVRESSSANLTAQPGGGQFVVGSVQMFHLHFHVTSNWDWTDRDERDRLMEKVEITDRRKSFHVSVQLIPTSRARGSLINSCISVFTRHRAIPMSSPGTKARGNQTARDSCAVTDPTSWPSTEREKLTG